MKTYMDPDFQLDQSKPTKNDDSYYTSLMSCKENEILKKKVFYKAYNIGLGVDKELSINMVLNIFLCSNETLRVSLLLTDLQDLRALKPMHHIVNFNKHTFKNGSKLYSELLRYKEFFFVIQIELGTLEHSQSSAFEVGLF